MFEVRSVFDGSNQRSRFISERVACIVGGVDLPAGAEILMITGSANRDETRFPGGESLDITRENARQHLSFGYGIHYCLGFQLAKMEGAILLRQLAERFPTLRLAPDFVAEYLLAKIMPTQPVHPKKDATATPKLAKKELTASKDATPPPTVEEGAFVAFRDAPAPPPSEELQQALEGIVPSENEVPATNGQA